MAVLGLLISILSYLCFLIFLGPVVGRPGLSLIFLLTALLGLILSVSSYSRGAKTGRERTWFLLCAILDLILILVSILALCRFPGYGFFVYTIPLTTVVVLLAVFFFRQSGRPPRNAAPKDDVQTSCTVCKNSASCTKKSCDGCETDVADPHN